MPQSEINRNINWYALYTRPRHEFKAAQQLANIKLEYYLPTTTKLKQWSDRKKKVTEPIFRGYIFIHCDERGRLDALQQNSIVKTISFHGKPAIVPEWQIENLKKLLEGNPDIIVSDQIKEGAKIKVVSGPFKDVEGIVTYIKNERMLAITIDTLHRSILVTLPAESVVKKVDS
ncbi:MAG: hypothetical protein A2V66_09360 [Ignavibacteria bacterium RBG_13_36_8]|nr:MAG: hypothetical protein A2V66_09360 [Ignavibacteria bacterium RBG_13_36_8]